MSSPPSVKVLAVGSALGSISNLFTKVKTINAKHGPFELLLCTGDFFGPPGAANESEEVDALLSGQLEVPIPSYIMQGDFPLPQKVITKLGQNNGQLCPNLFLMGKSNLLVTSQGLRVGIFGGTYDPEGFNLPLPEDVHPLSVASFDSHMLKAFLANPLLPQEGQPSASTSFSAAKNPQYIDILMTHEWPAGITQHCTLPLPDPGSPSWGAHPLQALARLRPRYHFASGGGPRPIFWERQPYVWDEDSRVSRFVSLGAFGGPDPEAGKKKERWFYAFSIAPQTEPSQPQPRPANATPSPFANRGGKRELDTGGGENFIWGNDAKRARRDGTKPPPGYACKICQSPEHFIRDCPQRADNKGPPAGYKCKICDGSDHFIKDCPQKGVGDNVPPENYVCKICSQPGHYVKHCPEKNAVGNTGGKKPPQGYVCRACGSEAHYIKDCPSASARSQGGERGERRKEIGPDECWFCLSNPRVTKHLIVSIGSECYMTAPKGQLPPTDGTGPTRVPGGGHVLIIPISHYPTLQSVPSDLAIPIISEMERYKSALRSTYEKYGAAPVVFEVARLTGKGGHAHVQVVPVPLESGDQVEEQFRRDGETNGIDWEEDGEAALEHAARSGENYFKVDLPDGRKLVHIMKPGRPFNLQFGRIVLANLLGLKERADWKACTSSDEAEKKDASLLKSAFAPFDPSV
ncbi:hypothetical protein FRC04_002900 [Tulasnella sp. 424]|nr:hypothetical protein FRC04_002900 [Tulasnella sp. 424]KAG8981252.1 hypothetical protein FRC05_004154 [Tulasnella sp. 425]